MWGLLYTTAGRCYIENPYMGGEKRCIFSALLYTAHWCPHRKEIPSAFCYQWPTNWFSRMTNELLVCRAEVIPTRSCRARPACTDSLKLKLHVSRLRFILIFYLFPENMADKKHKCSWYCVLSYPAAKDWNPKKQFSVEMKELGLVNPGGK